MRTLEQIYAEGLRDGAEITLNLILGRPQEGGEPFNGLVSSSLRSYCETALIKIANAKQVR